MKNFDFIMNKNITHKKLIVQHDKTLKIPKCPYKKPKAYFKEATVPLISFNIPAIRHNILLSKQLEITLLQCTFKNVKSTGTS
jgi:hypothetical protein